MEELWNTNKVLIKKKDLSGQIFVSKNMAERINIDVKGASNINI